MFDRNSPVTLLLYEDIIADAGLSESHFGSAIGGVDVRLPRERLNPPATDRSVAFQRLRSFLTATRFDECQRTILWERCRAPNGEIASNLGRDLGLTGYPL